MPSADVLGGIGTEGKNVKEHVISFVGGENVPKLIVVMDTQLCKYNKNHKTVHCKLETLYIFIIPKQNCHQKNMAVE